MASQPATTLRGRRLVVGGIEDPARPKVLAVCDLGSALGLSFGVALVLSLGAAPLFVHGLALIGPPVAAVAGGVWGYLWYRGATRRSAAAIPPLPASAVVVPVGGQVVEITMKVTFAAGAIAAVVVGAGHGSQAVLDAGACVPPLLYGHMLSQVLLVRMSFMRHARQDGGRTIYQTCEGSKKQPARLYSAGGSHAG